ncbi:putative polysaccharide deacetylase [Microthyrium microscopicum]|uniref:chitin deacetylase n=1 Tax=Microthyrium microscopicum TaxID=703497 RepID=A0A6A6UFY8_9PEZI|nr:putative polysaccharide deacetylase [Microthyrium microscopicum]
MPSALSRLIRLPSRLQRRARRRRAATMLVILAVLASISFTLYSIYKPPSFLITYFQHRWPQVLWRVDTDHKVIALTIDDAPSEYTPAILELLRDNNAKATFFVIGGQVEGREDILRQIVSEGHELGNHAMRDEPSAQLSDETLMGQIGAVQGMIEHAYESSNDSVDGKRLPPPKYFRPGSGFFSARMLKLLDRMGYLPVLGNVYPHDPQISWWKVNARHILSMARPGSIIICHDRRSWTPPMLNRVLQELKKREYEVVTISDLLKSSR